MFPAPAGATITIQAHSGTGWHAVGQAAVSASGASSTQVPSGRYRIVDGTLDGPAVTVP